MDQSNQTEGPATESRESGRQGERHGRSGSLILHTLGRWTGRLYATIAHSAVGCALTAYRRLDSALGAKSRTHTSPRRRMPLADTVKNSHVLGLLRGVLRVLYDLPLRFYGVFSLFYGAFGILLYFLLPLIFPSRELTGRYLTVAVVMMLISLPPISSHSTLRESVSRSRFGGVILGRFFCIPQEPLPPSHKKLPFGISLLMVGLALITATGMLFVNPLILPLLIAAVIVFGMVFTYPEAGVLLTTALLPVVWLLPRAMPSLAALILLTWCSYLLKLLQLHRTIRLDLADMVILVLLGLSLISGVGGVIAGTGRMEPSVMLFVCLSEYFLIVHLMNTRAHVLRCLIGVGVAAVVMAGATLLGRVDPTVMDWMAGSRGGDLVVGLYSRVHSLAENAGGGGQIILSVMLIPLLYAFLVRARRLLSRMFVLAFLGVSLYLLMTGGSVGALICLACATLIFCLLMDHRSLVAGILILPGAVGACGWYLAWRGPLFPETSESLAVMLQAREVRWAELWQDVCRTPLGYGVGVDCSGGNLALEVLLTLGWQGFIVSLAALALLVHKSLTALAYAHTFADRALVLGLLVGVAVALLRGVTQGFLLMPHVLLMFVLFCALGSAFANILFEEHDVREAESMCSPEGADRLYRRR